MSDEIIFGIHAVQAALNTHPEKILEIIIQQERHDQKIQAIIHLAQTHKITIREYPKKKLDEMTAGVHQGILAKCHKAQAWKEEDLKTLLEKITEPAFILILDEVQDPHNLGACLRTANAAGVHCVIAPKDNSVGLTPAVKKVAAGAAEITPFIQVTNLARTIRWLKEQGIWIYGTTEDATESLFKTDLKGPMALAMGAEGHGLRRLTKDLCDFLIAIPMLGTVESLNVSVATAVCLYEAIRQRNNS